jgi:calpain-7
MGSRWCHRKLPYRPWAEAIALRRQCPCSPCPAESLHRLKVGPWTRLAFRFASRLKKQWPVQVVAIAPWQSELAASMSASTGLAQAEARARQAEARIEDENRRDASLSSTISAVELYMRALKLTDNAADRKRIDRKCKELLSRAEKITEARQQASTLRSDNVSASITPHSSKPGPPMSTRELSTREKIILLEGGKLNGLVFKAWEGPPNSEEFALHDGEDLFSDDPALPLSELQLESFAGWKRPQEALSSLLVETNGKSEVIVPTMLKGAAKVDLVQDMTSDCSVVASLCAGTARAERGHGQVCAKLFTMM